MVLALEAAARSCAEHPADARKDDEPVDEAREVNGRGCDSNKQRGRRREADINGMDAEARHDTAGRDADGKKSLRVAVDDPVQAFPVQWNGDLRSEKLGAVLRSQESG